jgi:hypothetical protein
VEGVAHAFECRREISDGLRGGGHLGGNSLGRGERGTRPRTAWRDG